MKNKNTKTKSSTKTINIFVVVAIITSHNNTKCHNGCVDKYKNNKIIHTHTKSDVLCIHVHECVEHSITPACVIEINIKTRKKKREKEREIENVCEIKIYDSVGLNIYTLSNVKALQVLKNYFTRSFFTGKKLRNCIRRDKDNSITSH